MDVALNTVRGHSAQWFPDCYIKLQPGTEYWFCFRVMLYKQLFDACYEFCYTNGNGTRLTVVGNALTYSDLYGRYNIYHSLFTEPNAF
jgi:hypothetical protein